MSVMGDWEAEVRNAALPMMKTVQVGGENGEFLLKVERFHELIET